MSAPSATCPVADRCGGCPLLGLSGEEQGRRKVMRVREELAAWLPRHVVDGLAIGWAHTRGTAYRRRIRMRVNERGHPELFNENKAYDCAVLTRPLVRAIESVRALRIPGAHHLEVREADLDGRAGLYVAPQPGEQVAPPHVPGFAVGTPEVVAWQRFAVTDAAWSFVPVDAFLQVHEATNRSLVRALVEGADARSAGRFFDAYAGAGNHALALAAAGRSGVAADRDVRAVDALRASVEAQSFPVEVASGDAAMTCRGREAELLIANPPRAGLREAAEPLARMGAAVVAIVACTPLALARDAAVFAAHGYVLDEVTCFDMFPQTDHVEALGWLRRKP